MKKLLLLVALVFVGFGMVGCRSPKLEQFEEVSNNETAFVIQLEGDAQAKVDSLEALKKAQVMTKRINIPLRWKKTGRLWFQGEWIPTVKVILVDRSPVTREWTADNVSGTSTKDQGIWVESMDSIGFSTGFNATSKVLEEDTALFLYNFPNGKLATIMDEQIRNEIQSVAAEVAARYKMDQCREKKLELIEEVRKIVIPKYKEVGITITTIGMFGGFQYEEKEIQSSINATFVAQQEKVTAAAMLEAQEDKNARVEKEAVGLANAAVTKAEGEAKAIEVKASAEAAAITLVNEAAKEANSNPVFLELKKLELETARVKAWDGKYPQWYMGGSEDMGLIVNPPAPSK